MSEPTQDTAQDATQDTAQDTAQRMSAARRLAQRRRAAAVEPATTDGASDQRDPSAPPARRPRPKKGVQVPLGEPTVVVHRVSMRYRVPSDAVVEGGGLAAVRSKLGLHRKVTVRALSSVSFVARAGESIGIVGQNGSGKSTLLRIIAGLETPTKGTVRASATPSFLGVNAALLADLSGMQNARLGLLAMGKTPDEVEDALPDVLQLADIGGSIDLPMRTYSSGMAARLRFAIAAAAEPEILLIDEALGTGDAASKKRSERRMTQIRENAGTVFLVSHAAKTIEEMCTRAIWLHKGEILLDGAAYETARAYRWWAWNVAKGEHATAAELIDAARSQLRSTVVTAHDSESDRYIPRHGRTI